MQTTFGISTTRGWKFGSCTDPRRGCIDWINCKNVEYSVVQIPAPTRNTSAKWINHFVMLDHLKVLTSHGQTNVAKARFNPVLVSGGKLMMFMDRIQWQPMTYHQRVSSQESTRFPSKMRKVIQISLPTITNLHPRSVFTSLIRIMSKYIYSAAKPHFMIYYASRLKLIIMMMRCTITNSICHVYDVIRSQVVSAGYAWLCVLRGYVDSGSRVSRSLLNRGIIRNRGDRAGYLLARGAFCPPSSYLALVICVANRWTSRHKDMSTQQFRTRLTPRARRVGALGSPIKLIAHIHRARR